MMMMMTGCKLFLLPNEW